MVYLRGYISPDIFGENGGTCTNSCSTKLCLATRCYALCFLRTRQDSNGPVDGCVCVYFTGRIRWGGDGVVATDRGRRKRGPYLVEHGCRGSAAIVPVVLRTGYGEIPAVSLISVP